MWIEILYEFYILDQLRLICWLAFLLVHVLLRSRWPLLHQKLSQWNKMCWRWRKGPLFHHQYCHLSKKCNWFDFSLFCLSWKQKEYWKFLTSFSTSFHNLKLFGNYIEYCLFVFWNILFQRPIYIRGGAICWQLDGQNLCSVHVRHPSPPSMDVIHLSYPRM